MSKLKQIKSSSNTGSESSPIYTILAILVGLLVIAILYSIFFNSGSSVDFDVLEQGGHVEGNPDGSVRIVEFSDFQCPACGGAYPVVKRVLAEYPEKVKITYRHFPLTSIHPYAQKAAEASECAADQGKFWEMHDKLFENQTALTLPDLKAYASEIGINVDEFNSCLETGAHAANVAASASYAFSIGVNSTPTFFINGEKYSNLSFEQFKSVIDSKQ
ncbi:MAG: hypothetical protein COV47_03190 [Candidatus Diapherotrites archaeon CG11_big_fil_rev_8_21_14_0_20_37_9]|nr:MAG: hypothetical protein COV47_03190 [Candidatus Diapherotrites archaeon CG11_big_fil_rev_8_21_14_0_20_37_9]